MENINLRQRAFSGYESFTNKGAELTHDETDDNFVGLYERIHRAIPVGSILMWYGATAPTDWLLCNGATLGNTASGADNAADKYLELFKLVWASALANPGTIVAVDDSLVAVDFSTVVVTATAAFTAGYRITLPNFAAQFPRGKDTGELIGDGGGADTFDASHSHADTLAVDSGGAHTHTVSVTIASQASHTHALSGNVASSGAHTHTATDAGHNHAITIQETEVAAGAGATVLEKVVVVPTLTENGTASVTTASDGAHVHAMSGSTDAGGSHDHGGTAAGTAASGGAHVHTVSGVVSEESLEVDTKASY
jgi:hypothetical protein